MAAEDGQRPTELVEEKLEMPLAQPIGGTGLHEAFARILADRLEEAVPALAVELTVVEPTRDLLTSRDRQIEYVVLVDAVASTHVSAASSVHAAGNTDRRLSNCRSTSDSSW